MCEVRRDELNSIDEVEISINATKVYDTALSALLSLITLELEPLEERGFRNVVLDEKVGIDDEGGELVVFVTVCSAPPDDSKVESLTFPVMSVGKEHWRWKGEIEH